MDAPVAAQASQRPKIAVFALKSAVFGGSGRFQAVFRSPKAPKHRKLTLGTLSSGFPTSGTDPAADEHGLIRGACIGPVFPHVRVFRCLHPRFRSSERVVRLFSAPKCPSRGTFCEIGIARHRKTGIKPISRPFLAGPPAPYSPYPQPLAPLTRLRISAILLPLGKTPPAM